MRKVRILAALGLLAAATAANAEVSSTWTLTNDYDFRGFSQSAKDPAVQASLDYAHDSGWYVGAWASNVDFGEDADVDYEVDLYTGFSGGAEDGLGWDVGVVYYTYPDESDFNYLEAYGSLTYDWFKAKLWYSNDFGGDTTDGDTSAIYIEANATFPLPQNFSFSTEQYTLDYDVWPSPFNPSQLIVGVTVTSGDQELVNMVARNIQSGGLGINVGNGYTYIFAGL